MGVVLTGVSSVAVGMAGGLPVGTKIDAFDLAALLVVSRDVFMLVGKLMLGAQAITRLQVVWEDTHLPLASGVTDRYGILPGRCWRSSSSGYAYLWGRAVQSDCA